MTPDDPPYPPGDDVPMSEPYRERRFSLEGRTRHPHDQELSEGQLVDIHIVAQVRVVEDIPARKQGKIPLGSTLPMRLARIVILDAEVGPHIVPDLQNPAEPCLGVGCDRYQSENSALCDPCFARAKSHERRWATTLKA